MPVFISYSHADKAFVDKLARQLVAKKVHVWLDRWELNVGDSLISKVQDAIAGASALLVILSNSSVNSEWCKKELNSALIRELEEKRVVVLPILIEGCDIPLFLKEKVYADFRSDFDEGLRTTLEAIAKVTNEAQGRVDEPNWHFDWAEDWFTVNGHFVLRLTLVEQAKDQPYSVLSTVEMIADSEGTRLYTSLEQKGQGDAARREILGVLVGAIEDGMDLTVQLDDQFERVFTGQIRDSSTGASYVARASARRMGEDTGRDTLVHLGEQIQKIYRHVVELSKRPPEE